MVPFTKLEGTGNDFVFLDRVVEELPIDPGPLAIQFCIRRFGVGADGLILVGKGTAAPFRMEIFNPDGSNGGMCGNGVRCAARLIVEKGYHDLSPFNLEVEQRIVVVEPIRPDWIRVDMGPAKLQRRDIPMIGDPAATFIDQSLVEPLHPTAHIPNPTSHEARLFPVSPLPSFQATAVSMGNPHLVIFVDDVASVDLEDFGPRLENHELFPERTNVHFVQVLDKGRLRQRTWERGTGITQACGSGACSVAVAGFLTSRTDRKVRVSLPGGDLLIEYLESDHVIMEGPAERVFEGNWLGS